MNKKIALLIVSGLVSPALANADGITEFCLDGHLDLGARYQGIAPKAGEFYPTTWCLVSEDDSDRVVFTGTGKSNADMDGSWRVAYLPPDIVRIVNTESPPDVEFRGTNNLEEARRVRRIDPRRLLKELKTSSPDLPATKVSIKDDRVVSLATTAELPLRGRVPVFWNWDWADPDKPVLRLSVDDTLLYKATGRWRKVPDDEAAKLWQPTAGPKPVNVPGDRWPARVNMKIIRPVPGVYIVRGVRTGFQHMVVDTDEGLIVADAPAGWVEFHHIPPSDLVPGLGVSGLSEKLIDFLAKELPGRPIHAVVLTHFHDDHAGGARAFAAAGARIFVTAESAGFMREALNRSSMPRDRLDDSELDIDVVPVSDEVVLGKEPNRVKIVSMGAGPHAYAMLGVWALDKNYFFVSDVHVPLSDEPSPREERAVTECWFAKWAVDSLPANVQVANSHSPQLTPVARLAEFLDDPQCAVMPPD